MTEKIYTFNGKPYEQEDLKKFCEKTVEEKIQDKIKYLHKDYKYKVHKPYWKTKILNSHQIQHTYIGKLTYWHPAWEIEWATTRQRSCSYIETTKEAYLKATQLI